MIYSKNVHFDRVNSVELTIEASHNALASGVESTEELFIYSWISLISWGHIPIIFSLEKEAVSGPGEEREHPL